jgi:hypothetical protein
MDEIKKDRNATAREFSDLWMNLEPRRKKNRIDRAMSVILKASSEQLELLEKINNSKGIAKNTGFIYFFSTVKNFWDHVEFACSLGKGKNRRFCCFPARLLMETVLRLEFYVRQNKEEQDKIAIKEILRSCKRYYDRDKVMGRNTDEYIKYYNQFAKTGTYPDIDHVNPNIEPFPSIKKLTSDSKMNGADRWYFHFQVLAESTHGKFLAIKMAEQDDLGEYVAAMMNVLLMSNKALLIVNQHIGNIPKEFRESIVKAIKEAENIIKAPSAKVTA